jgi:molecular chaperone GrpE
MREYRYSAFRVETQLLTDGGSKSVKRGHMKRSDELDMISESFEVERLQGEVRRVKEMYLRVMADFDNFRRRVERERNAAARAGKREILQPLLEEIDSFDRALTHLSHAPVSVAQGIVAIHRNLLALLESHGVTPFESVGHKFDPEKHEALGTVWDTSAEPGTVVEEAQRGYSWGDEILRPARVRVAR